LLKKLSLCPDTGKTLFKTNKNMKKYAIGADIGGGHITVAVIDLNEASIVTGSHCRMDVDAEGSAEGILSAWADAIKQSVQLAADEAGIESSSIIGMGLAMPGPFDYENGIAKIIEQKKFRALYDMNVRTELADRTGFAPESIKFKNDAENFLRGCVFGGVGKGSTVAIGVTLGTGFGSAYYENGESADANLWCAPFRGKIAEDSISTRWFIARYEELTGKKVRGVKFLIDGMVNDTDEAAKKVFAEFSETLIEFLVPLVSEKKADTLILGGSIALSAHLFVAPLKAAMAKANPATRVLTTILGEEATLLGCASLVG